VVLDQPWQCPRPRAALRSDRTSINLEEAAVNALAPVGHRPVSQPLVEVIREESDEWRMDPCIRIDAVDRLNPIAVAGRVHAGSEQRIVRAANGGHTGVP